MNSDDDDEDYEPRAAARSPRLSPRAISNEYDDDPEFNMIKSMFYNDLLIQGFPGRAAELIKDFKYFGRSKKKVRKSH